MVRKWSSVLEIQIENTILRQNSQQKVRLQQGVRLSIFLASNQGFTSFQYRLAPAIGTRIEKQTKVPLFAIVQVLRTFKKKQLRV